jgi:hypothetical protein
MAKATKMLVKLFMIQKRNTVRDTMLVPLTI